MVEHKYGTSALNTQPRRPPPSLEQWEVRINPAILQANPNLTSWPKAGDTPVEYPIEVDQLDVPTFTPINKPEDRHDTLSGDESSSEDDDPIARLPITHDGLMVFHKFGGRKRTPVLERPDGFLESAAKFSIRTLVWKYQIGQAAARRRIQQASRIIADRDGLFEADVMLDMHKKQLANGIIQNRADMISMANGLATERLAKRKARRKGLQIMPKVFPCVFQDDDCADHDFCKERYLTTLAKMNKEDRARRKAVEEAFDLDNSSLAPAPYNQISAVQPAKQDPRMSIGFLTNDPVAQPASIDGSSTPGPPIPAPLATERIQRLPSYHPLRWPFEDDDNLSNEWLDRMQARLDKDPGFLDRRPPQKLTPLIHYEENGR